MLKNTLTKVRSCLEVDAMAITLYFYYLFSDIADMESHEECQSLYNELVKKFGLEKHAENVINACIDKLVKMRKLTPVQVGERYRHPFSARGKLKVNYREDETIYENCGNWDSSTLRDINLIRVLFSDSSCSFAKIIGMTFFITPEQFEKNERKIPSSIVVPAKFKKAVENVDSVKFVADILKLSKEETLLLQTAFRLQIIKEIYDVCNDLFRNDEFTRIDLYATCLSRTQKEIRLLLKRDQKLKSYGLIGNEGEMDEDAVDAIADKNMNSYFTDIIKPEKKIQAYELNSFSVSADRTALAVQFLKSDSSCNILLYGAPGSGKTEYAKALIQQAGLQMATYKNELELNSRKLGSEDVSAKALGRLNCYLSLKKKDSILVVDEAETVLKTTSSFFGMKFSLPQKGVVNKMLENSENKVIWILNYTDELDESTLRRFTYSIHFNEMPHRILNSIAEKKFNDVKMPQRVKSEILNLCSKYEVTGASVENIVKTLKSMDYSEDKERQIIKDVRNVLEANSSLLHGKKKMRNSVSDSYNLSVLNTTTPAAELVEMLENAVACKEENPDNPQGIRMLFYGLSGTGKTELARYMSEKLGKKLLLKRASDIMDKYVGESEKRIKEAFEEAEETDSILLFDEADSFFSDRANAKQNWERTMVNEFLTQMEEFSGILICTTNLRKIMDPALQRRFHILTEFRPLNQTGIKELLNSYFGKYEFAEEQINGLLQSDTVTPGDFGTLNSKLRFVSKDKITSEYIVQELRNIQKEKLNNGNCRIGFAS